MALKVEYEKSSFVNFLKTGKHTIHKYRTRRHSEEKISKSLANMITVAMVLPEILFCSTNQLHSVRPDVRHFLVFTALYSIADRI